MMRKGTFLLVFWLSFSALGLANFETIATASACATDDKAKALVGTWTGSWAGGSSGQVEFKLVLNAEGKLTGEITPRPSDGESYTVPFSSVVQAGNQLTLKLNTPGDTAEVTLDGKVEGTTFKATYIVKLTSDGSEVDRGTLTAMQKP